MMRLEASNSHQTLNAHCQAVGSDQKSIIYECQYQVEDSSPRVAKSQIHGKFALNAP